jgi:hypothetical protein
VSIRSPPGGVEAERLRSRDPAESDEALPRLIDPGSCQVLGDDVQQSVTNVGVAGHRPALPDGATRAQRPSTGTPAGRSGRSADRGRRRPDRRACAPLRPASRALTRRCAMAAPPLTLTSAALVCSAT